MPAHKTRSLKTSLIGAGVAFGFASLVGGGAARANDWTSLGFDAGRARATDEKSGAAFSSAWNANPAGSAIVASPLVADGLVVVAGAKGDVVALHAVDGTQAWTIKAAGDIGASPAIDGGRIFLPTLNGRLQALHLSTGTEAWSQAFGGQNYSSPVVVDDSLGKGLVVAAGFPEQKVVRLGLSTGTSQWETPRGVVADLVNSSVALSGGRLTFGVNGGRYQALDALTGAASWNATATGAVGLSAPLVSGTTAFFLPGGKAATLSAANVATGELLAGWPVQVLDPAAPDAATVRGARVAVSSPVAMGGLVVFVARFEYDLAAQPNGAPGKHPMHELVVAVDPAKIAVAWQQQIGSREAATLNEVPELNLSPTPVVFATEGNPLVAVTSSLDPKVRVLDLGGAEQWSTSLSAPTRSSPVFANGLLVVATEAGVVHAFASSVNHAPVIATDGFSPVEGEVVEGPTQTFSWAAANDAEGQAVTYQVRVLSAIDGDLRETWLKQVDAAPGETSIVLARDELKAGLAYRYAVRARDALGAWSDWSTERTFTLALPAKIDVGGQSFDTLADALASLPASGGVINVGRGVVHLHSSLVVPGGVSVVGAGAHDTILDATGQVAGVQLKSSGRTGAASLKSLTVTGADVGVQVVDVQNAVLRNLVLRDNKKVGVQVEEGASADAANLTIARNPTGASVSGKLAIRSSIVTANDKGFERLGAGSVTSRYNDVAGNKTSAYDGFAAGTGDLAVDVSFRSSADFHLSGIQPTTDMGDPADAFTLEPQPNGARVNMGAFGNTTTAELSRSSDGWTTAATTRSVSSVGPTPVGDPSTPSSKPPGGGGSGCSVAPMPTEMGSGFAWFVLALSAGGALLMGRRRRQ
jgi:outer membrane protein assembly factor BamB